MTELVHTFSQTGLYIKIALLTLACVLCLSGGINLFRKEPVFCRQSRMALVLCNIVFILGFLSICWFHFRIYRMFPLELSRELADWLNLQLAEMNRSSEFGLPLYDIAKPPRYMIPVWIENEKYYFWFMCYGIMCLMVHFRSIRHNVKALVEFLLGVQIILLFVLADPFIDPLPRFFREIGSWFDSGTPVMQKLGLFMGLYPKMIFYYNASYMWFHPPLLFLSYGCITVTFVTSMFMLANRDTKIEAMGYDFAKSGYFMLTLGMLLGYPWAIQAWGPNWWWDPKICSSIMMWAIFSTYLHTRLYLARKEMWYFSSALGILCFLSMIFTFLTSFYFPGEHTFQ